jgi:thiol-disulfide isomerase/thioredoxin
METGISRLTNAFRFTDTFGNSWLDNFFTGASLGILWTPCSGPVMTVVATLAASQIVTYQILLIALVYSVGIAIPILILSLSEQWFISHHSYLNNHTGLLQKFFGIVTITSAILMYTQYDKVLQEYIFSRINLPLISNNLEALPSAQSELEKLRSLRTNTKKYPYTQLDIYKNINQPSITPGNNYKSALPYLGKAIEIDGITKWFNTDYPLTLSQYRNKVILLDFWAYTCAACLPSIPRKNGMRKIYPSLVIITLHEPSTRDGKSEENVKRAIEQYGVEYPVGMDNNFVTWDRYKNTYLPSEYVIDKQGNIRFISTNGGETDKVEYAIQELLKESNL